MSVQNMGTVSLYTQTNVWKGTIPLQPHKKYNGWKRAVLKNKLRKFLKWGEMVSLIWENHLQKVKSVRKQIEKSHRLTLTTSIEKITS